jgi:hypothetical protein
VADALANALKEKKELQERLERIEQFLALYDEFSRTKEETVDTLSGVSSAVRGTVDAMHRVLRSGTATVVTEQVVPPRRLSPVQLAVLAKGAIKDAQHPLTRYELVSALEERGVIVPGETKEMKGRYVGTIMWRNSDDFENIEGRGYWLKGAPAPDEIQQADLGLEKR